MARMIGEAEGSIDFDRLLEKRDPRYTDPNPREVGKDERVIIRRRGGRGAPRK